MRHLHRPDTEGTMYAYCLDCKALITSAAASGMVERRTTRNQPVWRVTASRLARILAGPVWEHPCLL